MTSNKCFDIQLRHKVLIMYDDLTWTTFPGQAQSGSSVIRWSSQVKSYLFTVGFVLQQNNTSSQELFLPTNIY